MTALSLSRQTKLDFWLENDPAKFEKYLIAHPEIADAYESLHSLNATIREALQEAVAVPVDFVARLWDRTAERDDTGAFAVSLDILGLGLATAKTLLFDPE